MTYIDQTIDDDYNDETPKVGRNKLYKYIGGD